MLKNIKCLGHSTILIKRDNINIYVDPYNINEYCDIGDIIFITHNHYDHFSESDIKKIKKDNTIIVITDDLYDSVLNLGFSDQNIIVVSPNENYKIHNIKFKTIPAYNLNKNFHPREKNWVGYIIEINKIKYYIAGDTDVTLENKKVKCDVAFIPVGGTFTMNYQEAAALINEIEPKIAIPIHYGILVGSKEDALNFKKYIKDDINCEIMY